MFTRVRENYVIFTDNNINIRVIVLTYDIILYIYLYYTAVDATRVGILAVDFVSWKRGGRIPRIIFNFENKMAIERERERQGGEEAWIVRVDPAVAPTLTIY